MIMRAATNDGRAPLDNTISAMTESDVSTTFAGPGNCDYGNSTNSISRGSLSSSSSKTSSPFRFMRSLPGYRLGDALRPRDERLCQSKEAATYALAHNVLRAGDCVFIVRSDKTSTYAKYEGRLNKDEPDRMSFLLDNYGRFKLVRADESTFSRFVKIPAVSKDKVDEFKTWLGKSASSGNVNRLDSSSLYVHHTTPTSAPPPSGVARKNTDSNDILSRLAAAKTNRGGSGSNECSGDILLKMVTATSVGNLRLASPQQGSRSNNNFVSVPEESKPDQQVSLSRRGSMPTLNQRRQKSKGSSGFLGNYYPTVENIPECSDTSRSRDRPAANATWDINPTAQSTSMSANPLLKMMAKRESSKGGAVQTPANNPLLKMMEEHNSKKRVDAAAKPENCIRRRPSLDGEEKLDPDENRVEDPFYTARKFEIGTKSSLEISEVYIEETKLGMLVSKLDVDDGAFVKRSDGSFRYAILIEKARDTLTFQVSEDGFTRKYDLLTAGKYIIPEYVVTQQGGRGIDASEEKSLRRSLNEEYVALRNSLTEEKMVLPNSMSMQSMATQQCEFVHNSTRMFLPKTSSSNSNMFALRRNSDSAGDRSLSSGGNMFALRRNSDSTGGRSLSSGGGMFALRRNSDSAGGRSLSSGGQSLSSVGRLTRNISDLSERISSSFNKELQRPSTEHLYKEKSSSNLWRGLRDDLSCGPSTEDQCKDTLKKKFEIFDGGACGDDLSSDEEDAVFDAVDMKKIDLAWF